MAQCRGVVVVLPGVRRVVPGRMNIGSDEMIPKWGTERAN